jgi:hypothetical protein
MSMSPEKAAQLRKPFEPAQIGRLPKGGVMLDYVGHAATTDRLLQVDPSWTWEPLAVDAQGLPAVDQAGNLWIKLTVCGVTRLGVGDGKNMKERIGDAIRNAAMRFGVALDLWAKEDLNPEHRDETPKAAPVVTRGNSDVAEAQARVWAASNIPLKNGNDDTRREFIRKAITDRGYDRLKVSDLNDLASEWELAK